jgi:alpha-beta hydrolase superfamily lysophospholipase
MLSALYRLAEEGWVILAADLPGHGFSSGDQAGIGDFAEYARITEQLFGWIDTQDPARFPPSHVLLGHSAGGAAALASLLDSRIDLDAAVLLAPLVKPRCNAVVLAASWILAPFVRGLPPRGFEEEYLGVDSVPLSWIRALGLWESRWGRSAPLFQGPLIIIQGEKDDYLAWRAGIARIRRLWPASKLQLLPEAGHVLLDRGRDQELTLASISAFLRELPQP